MNTNRLTEIETAAKALMVEALEIVRVNNPNITDIQITSRGQVGVWNSEIEIGSGNSTIEAYHRLLRKNQNRISRLRAELAQLENEKQ